MSSPWSFHPYFLIQLLSTWSAKFKIHEIISRIRILHAPITYCQHLPTIAPNSPGQSFGMWCQWRDTHISGWNRRNRWHWQCVRCVRWTKFSPRTIQSHTSPECRPRKWFRWRCRPSFVPVATSICTAWNRCAGNWSTLSAKSNMWFPDSSTSGWIGTTWARPSSLPNRIYCFWIALAHSLRAFSSVPGCICNAMEIES